MKIQCNCGQFEAELTNFPKNSPGRLMCYCDDCQKLLNKINRADLLDSYGGTEVIPVYPDEFQILKGQEFLRCNRLSKNGINRWTANCCNSPIGNTRAKFPWFGIFHSAFTVKDKSYLENLGPVRSRIMGKYAKGNPPFKIPDKIGVGDVMVVAPFLMKGMLFKKYKNSPFFKEDGVTPISEPVILR